MRRSWSERARLGAWVLASLCLPALAHAQAPASDTPDAHLQAGLAFRREHQNVEALSEFRRAYELAPTPRARAQIGFAEQALARWVEAEGDLQAALEAPTDEWIARNRGVIDAALRTIDQQLGWLTIAVDDPHARVALDGVLRAEGAPPRARVTAGAHAVRVEIAGAPTLDRNVDVRPRDEVRLVLLAPVPAPPAAVTSTPIVPVDPPPARPAPSLQRTAGYTLGVAGLTAITTSLVLGAVALHERGVVADHCRDHFCDPQGLAAGQVGAPLTTWATIAFVGGAVSLGAGATLVLTAPSPRAPVPGVALRMPLP